MSLFSTAVEIHTNITEAGKSGEARIHRTVSYFVIFPSCFYAFLALAGLYLFYLFHDLLLFKFVVVSRKRKRRTKSKMKLSSFSKNEKKALNRSASCGCYETRMTTAHGERGDSEYSVCSFNIPTAVIFMNASRY